MKSNKIPFLVFLILFSGLFLDAAASPTPFQGFYVGVNTGYVGAIANTHLSASSYDDNSYFYPDDIAHLNQGILSRPLNTNAFLIGGLTGGYNWQLKHFLLGIETDFNFLNLNTTRTASIPTRVNPDYSQTLIQQTQANWLATLRPRIGLISKDFFSIYLTAGLALANLNNSNTYADKFEGDNANASAHISAIQYGWIVGLGEEIFVTPNWSIKAEYLYVNFPSINSSGRLSKVSDSPTWPSPQSLNYSTELQFNIMRLGVNYHF